MLLDLVIGHSGHIGMFLFPQGLHVPEHFNAGENNPETAAVYWTYYVLRPKDEPVILLALQVEVGHEGPVISGLLKVNSRYEIQIVH